MAAEEAGGGGASSCAVDGSVMWLFLCLALLDFLSTNFSIMRKKILMLSISVSSSIFSKLILFLFYFIFIFNWA